MYVIIATILHVRTLSAYVRFKCPLQNSGPSEVGEPLFDPASGVPKIVCSVESVANIRPITQMIEWSPPGCSFVREEGLDTSKAIHQKL
jgi:hypothetical protein